MMFTKATVLAAALALGGANVGIAQRPNRPPESRGQKGGRPEGASQRPNQELSE